MHVEKINTNSSHLDESMSGAIPRDADQLLTAANLLYEIMNESTRYAFDALEVEVNGDYKGITTLYHDCVSLVKKIFDGGEKTAFLAMSALENTFTKALPLLLVHVESILDGSSHMIENVEKLQKIFADNPYKDEWQERSAQFKEIIESIGLSARDADYSNLSAVMDPLLDALTFYDSNHRYDPIRRFRFGPKGDTSVHPAFSIHVPVFQSESDMVNAMRLCGKENAVMFAGLELTYFDTESPFQAWFTGYDNERMTNIMRNCSLTREQYFTTVDPYSRKIYTCVKAGGEVYLVPMPYKRRQYGGEDISDETKYCYGYRASYAPYQAFYDEPPGAQEDTTFLVVPRKAYRLSDLMDPAQKAWLPAFLNETVNYFFTTNSVEAMDAYLSEERTLVTPDGTEMYHNPVPETALARMGGRPAIARLQAVVPDPVDLFDEPFMKRLVAEFKVTPFDLAEKGELILFGRATENLDLDSRFRMTALRLVCERARDRLSNVANANWQIKEILQDQYAVIERILSGACSAFTEIVVKGAKDSQGVVRSTYLEDARPRHWLTVFWYSSPTSSAPPVVYKVRPTNAEDYAALLGVSVDELVSPLHLYTDLNALWTNYQHSMPRSMSYNRTLEPKRLMSLNLCMTRTEYKQIMKKTEKN